MGNSSFNLQDHVDHLLHTTFHFLRKRVRDNSSNVQGVLLVGERYRVQVYQSFQQHKAAFKRIGMEIKRQGIDGSYDEGEWCTLKLDEYFKIYENADPVIGRAFPLRDLLEMGN